MRMTVVIILAGLLPAAFMGCDSNMPPEARLKKLRALADKEDFSGAETELKLLMIDLPTDSAVLFLGARVYAGMNQFDSAVTYAKKFTVLYPRDLNGYRMLYNVAGKIEDYDAQIWAVSQLGYIENNRRKYHYDIADLNYKRGEFGMAIVTCKQMLEYDSTNVQVLFLLASSLAAAGQIDSALAVMEKLDQRHPNKVEIVSNLASFFAGKRDYDKAIVHFKRLTTLFPDYLPGWFGLGNVYLQKADTTAAIEAYRQVYTRDSTFLRVDSILNSLQGLPLY
jgi:tetratricopeptide (TPR) repeat protein